MKKYLSLFFSFVFLFSIIISPLTSSALSPIFSGDTDPDVEDSAPIESSCIDLKYNMQYRARDINTNGEVSLLQDFLQSKGYLNNEPTGYFGILTTKAVVELQKANNIFPSIGYVGPITRAKIKALTCGDLSGPICDYANPPDNCEYVKGPNYNSQTQCGLVLKCEDIKVCPAGTTGIYPNCTNILKPTITVSTPNGGESWNVGSTQKITWSSKYTTEGSWVALFLENSKNQTQLLAQKLPVNGSYSYLVSDFFCSGDVCYPDKIDGYYKIIARVYNGTKDICGGLCPYDPKPESVLITEDKSDSVFKINTPYQSCPTGTTGIYPNCVTTVTPKPTITSYRSDMITTSERIVIPIMKWDSQNATSCVASSNPLNPSWSGPKSTSGQQEITNHKVITVLSLTCENASGSDSKSWTIYADGVKPALILTATPTSVSSGGSTQLSWFSTNAPNCIATANPSNTNWSGTKAVSSNQTLYNLQSNTTYTLTCSNKEGEKVSKSVDVGVKIVDDFKPSIVKTYPKGGETFNPGETIKVTWESKNLGNHLITAGLAFNKYESGYNPIKSTYKLYLPNTGETSITIPSVSELKALNIFSNSFHVDLYAEELKNGVYQNAVIDPIFKGFKINIPCDSGQTGAYPNCTTTVTPKPTVNLTANPTSVSSGGSTTLSWTSTNATSCTASANPSNTNWSGNKATSGSQTIFNLTQSTSFSIICTGQGGFTSASGNVINVTTNNNTYPAGCTSNTGYSTTTGLSCSTTTSSSVDRTPRIAYWSGKVNQHIDSNGAWQTDPDGTSGANIDKLTYCKSWYPTTTSVKDYKFETINTWRQAYNEGPYHSAGVMTTECVGGQVLGASTEKNPNLCSLDSTLLKGMKSKEVKCLQQKLNQKGYKVVGTEGGKEHTQFGYYTMLALKKFQAENSLKADGILGIRTRELLNQ